MTAAPSPRTLALLERLVAFPTVSRGSNLALIDWARAELEAAGATCRVIPDAEGRRANLLATLGRGRGPGLAFSGHTDVVPVEGQDWATDPFAATVVGDRVHGRGTSDMKGFIAVVMALAPEMARAPGRFHIALSYDEEVGCLGAPDLAAALAGAEPRPRGCVVGEPTGLRPIVGHKGAAAYECRVTGRTVHASLAPRGVNAIEYAARLITRLRAVAAEVQGRETHHPGFDIPFTTASTGVVEGGSAANITPDACVFRFDLRLLPGTRPEDLIEPLAAHARDELLPEMRTVAPESDIVFRRLGGVPAFEADPDGPFLREVERAAGSNGERGYVAFATEAGLFHGEGIPTVVCGPGSIEQAHKPNEFIELAQLAQAESFVRRLITAG